ncbi:GerAB/ArcD/ProY family transporter [Gracilibacillus kekensis]|uniref:Spore germination protein (Amino acid permease) n=1 Tax=Gracilibacillus kekensis TaxID=1027249 RepID=A0A1M7LAB5_9BACI|nr:GerAB/ArcD/ProY family transporter [Gracilibacillus kekensis]SHM74923.1 spore germination protein (amino acid permease) [Gracilibacillus kekensis]
MNSNVKVNKMVSPYLLFFLIHSTQTGVMVLSFQSDIIKGAGHNAWLSIFAIGIIMHVIFLMLLAILKKSSAGDLLSFHTDVFGKFFGGFLNVVIAIYFAMLSLYVFHTYIDILQLWVFDGIRSWEFSLLLIVLVFYIVSGGFRSITAIAFWGVIIPSFLLLTLVYLVNFAETTYLLPLMQFGMNDFYISMKEAAPLFFGFETALIYFPFIKDRKKATKWGHLAIIYSTFLYVSITIVTFLFFSQGKLEHLPWPTLTMIKIIKLPFLERFEFIFIFTWLLVVMPVLCIYLWSAIRSIKSTIPKVKPTYVLIGFLAVFYLFNSLLFEIKYSYLLEKMVSYSGLTFIFGYIPLLFLISIFKKKVN